MTSPFAQILNMIGPDAVQQSSNLANSYIAIVLALGDAVYQLGGYPGTWGGQAGSVQACMQLLANQGVNLSCPAVKDMQRKFLGIRDNASGSS